MPVPEGVPWRYAKPGELNPGEFGSTSWKGDIIVRRGLSPQIEAETIRHEAVHRFLTPLGDSGVASFRQGARAWFYNKSVVMRVLEEGAAETYATRSLARGVALPFGGGYSLAPGLGDVALAGGVGGVVYIATKKPEGSR